MKIILFEITTKNAFFVIKIFSFIFNSYGNLAGTEPDVVPRGSESLNDPKGPPIKNKIEAWLIGPQEQA